jgi:hypothetical protein
MSVSFPRLLLCSRAQLICFHRDFYQKDRRTAVTTTAEAKISCLSFLVDCITLKQKKKNEGRSSERYIDNFLFISIHLGFSEMNVDLLLFGGCDLRSFGQKWSVGVSNQPIH